MKHVKLFEAFISENYTRSSVKFEMHDLYQMPNGLSRDKVYLVRFHYELSKFIYALMDYSGLEKAYELLNLYSISKKIEFYSKMIFSGKKMIDPIDAIELLNWKTWEINIFAEAEGGEFPYYVYIPGRFDDIPFFDPGMGMELSDIIHDNSGTHETPKYDDHIRARKGYYIRFDSLGANFLEREPSFSNNSKIFELLDYKPALLKVRETIFGKEGARDFLDDIFAYLINEDTPRAIVKEISDILN